MLASIRRQGREESGQEGQWHHNSQVLTITDVLLLQVDFRLIGVLGVLYLLSHIDRGNIGNAKIEGMDKDIGLAGNQYNIASTIFFVPYILFGKHLLLQTMS